MKLRVPFKWRILWKETQAVTVSVTEKTILNDVAYLFLTGRTVPGELDVGIAVAQFGHGTCKNVKGMLTRLRHNGGTRVSANRQNLGFQPVRGQATNESGPDEVGVFVGRHKASRRVAPGNPALAIGNYGIVLGGRAFPKWMVNWWVHNVREEWVPEFNIERNLED